MRNFLITNIEMSSKIGPNAIQERFDSTLLTLTFPNGEYNPDSANFEDESVYSFTNGCILNSNQLETNGNVARYLAKAAADGLKEPFQDIRGTFSGAYYTKADGRWTVFTNQLGDHPVYYFQSGRHFAASSSLKQLQSLYAEIGLKPIVNPRSVTAMLTYGYQIPGDTIIAGIRRLKPGEYLEINETVTVQKYHSFTRSVDESISFDDAVDGFEEHFTRSVRNQFEHDIRFKRAHLADLSGGLDARMVSWVARREGYGPFTNITYSQSSFEGLRITEKIARGLGNHLLVSQMDDAQFLFDSERIIKMNDASAFYAGITGGERLLRGLNWNHFGVEHTGQLGDVIAGGSYLSEHGYARPKNCAGLYSSLLQDKLDTSHMSAYQDSELYMFEVRGLGGILSTHLTRQHYTQPVSPFLDLELVNFCFSLPADFRAKNRLYAAWMKRHHAGAAAIPNDNTGAPVTAGKARVIASRVLRAAPRRLARRIPALAPILPTPSMNPFDRWWDDVHGYAEHAEAIVKQVYSLEVDDSVRADILRVFEQGSAIEKSLAMSAVQAITQFVG